MSKDVQNTTGGNNQNRDLPPLNILLVEDSVVSRTVLAGLLQKHRVVTASGGKQAVALMATERFHIVLMDVHMPEMDGLEATAAIRNRETGQRTPIIALTASTTTEARDECLAAGMDGFLAKPVQPDDLHRAIGEFVPSHCHAMSTSAAEKGPALLDSQACVEVIDVELAQRQIPGGPRGVSEMARLLCDQCPVLVMEIQAAVTDGDVKRVHRTAHSLKGSADIFAARRVVDVARRIELAGQNGDVAAAAATLPELREQVAQLQSALMMVAASGAS